MQARIMGRPAVQRRTFQFGFLLVAVMFGDSAAALDFQALTPLVGTGHNLDLQMVSSGRGHLVYRRPRRGEIYYRHFNGTSWSNEVQVNDASSLATSRKLDVNQPRLALDGEGGAWISWAKDRPTNTAYLRHVTSLGVVDGAILAILLPANVEDLHVIMRPGELELHVIALLVEGETRADGSVDPSRAAPRSIATGTYDVLVDPEAATAISATLFTIPGTTPPLQKNIDALLGPGPDYLLHEMGRFHRASYGQYAGTSWNVQIVHPEVGLAGELGATQMALGEGGTIHLASESFDLDTSLHELQYTLFDPNEGSLSGAVKLDTNFKSVYGVASIASTGPSRVLVVWDREEPATVPRLRYAFKDESTGAGFIGPITLPLETSESAGEHPAISAVGQKVHLVYNDPFGGHLVATVADFDLTTPPTPTPVPTSTPIPSSTPTVPPTPSPTPTPETVAPGQPRTVIQEVGVNHQELRIDYRLSAPPPAGCTVQLELQMPGAEVFGVLALAVETRKVRVLDPKPGPWSLEISASNSCPPQGYYLNHSSAPLASSQIPDWAWASLAILALYLRRSRRFPVTIDREV